MRIQQKSKFLTESKLRLGSPHRVKFRGQIQYADVAELADAQVSEACEAIRTGSSPVICTIKRVVSALFYFISSVSNGT